MAKGSARKMPRARQRKRELASAEAVTVPATCDVAVVGGGASGLAAAITAAEGGASVVVLEAGTRCGATILATGNGRCNLSTVELDPKRYNDPAFVDTAMGERPLEEVTRFFRGCNLRWSLEGPRLYPLSRQASSVRNVLLARAEGAGVVLAPARRVTGVRAAAAGWEVAFEEGFGVGEARRLACRSVVLATGGAAGDALASQLGLAMVPARPALCPVACEPSPLSRLDGRRSIASVSLVKGLFPVWRERGEVLFRSYGLSGIVVFDLSRRAEAGDVALVDLAPDVSPAELRQMVDPFAHGDFKPGCLDGVLDPQIASLLERLARQRWMLAGYEPPEGAPQSDSAQLLCLAKALPFRVAGRAGDQGAQVTQGGIALAQVDPATMAVRGTADLFACGEALDVDGDCGGFNLSWAWLSGMRAGRAAAGTAREEGAC